MHEEGHDVKMGDVPRYCPCICLYMAAKRILAVDSSRRASVALILATTWQQETKRQHAVTSCAVIMVPTRR